MRDENVRENVREKVREKVCEKNGSVREKRVKKLTCA